LKQCAEKLKARQEAESSGKRPRPKNNIQKKGEDDAMVSAFERLQNGQITTDEYNEAAQRQYDSGAVEIGAKVSCPNCQRQFNRPEGLQKHRVLCDRSAFGNAAGAASNEQPLKEKEPVLKCNGCSYDFLRHVSRTVAERWRFCPECGHKVHALSVLTTES
jgi:hypothetical protein